ncbi:MAG: MMPL family transporter [Sulfurospirillum sp.]|nr:MMPL family transporter [Sulfurospirillum sp.]
MIRSFYQNTLLRYPLITLFIVIFSIASLGYFSKDLRIDASADTLLLEGDSDLAFTRQINQRYKSSDMLVVAFTPANDLLSEETLAVLQSLSIAFEKFPQIKRVTSILNVPLFLSPILPISELVKDVKTLRSPNINKALVKEEFLNNPFYKNNLVSKDLSTTAIVLELQDDAQYTALKKNLSLVKNDGVALQKAKDELKEHRDAMRVSNHQFIQDVRSVLAQHRHGGKLFLGGVNMIADDMIGFIYNDILLYGSALLVLLAGVLWIVFREIRWIIIPITICGFSILATTGILGLFGWEVTVISSNFVSLQLIITLSIVLHLIVRYRELVLLYPQNSQKELVLETMLSKLAPSFFAIITTIVGFGSLMLSDILPIINLGWMMSSGIFISLFIAFLLFPTLLLMLPKTTPKCSFEQSFTLTKTLANVVLHRGKYIYFATILIALFSLSGSTKLMVENSFINYFKSETQIYKGMEVIDAKLGGTTPLDLIVKFNEPEKQVEQEKNPSLLDEFFSEFLGEKDEAQYWFTGEKMALVEKIHDYLNLLDETRSVQSLANILKLGRMLNENKDLDNFKLALLYNKIPLEYKKTILDPYVNIEENEVRFSMRIADSNPLLRRKALLQKIDSDIDTMIKDRGTHRLSNLMVLYNNMLQSLFSSQILTLGFVAISLFLMFWIIFGSLKIAIIAITSNIIPMSIIFGFMGYFHIPLDLMTITIAAISLGIGVDDTIHYIHRFYEELQKDGNHSLAMQRSHESIGYAMYYTTFAIVLGFSILMLSNFVPTVYFGLLTVLVMIAALLGALLLLPRLLITFKI